MLDIDHLDPDALRRLCRDLLAENERLRKMLAPSPTTTAGEAALARMIRDWPLVCANEKACK